MVTRTNACINPSFEPNATSWNVLGMSAAQLSRQAASAVVGSWGLQIDCTGALGNQGVESSRTAIPAVVGQTWSASIYAHGTGLISLHLVERTSGGVGVGSSFTSGVTLSGTPQRLSVTRTLTGATVAFVHIEVRTNGAQDVTYSVDGVLIEQSPTVGDYFDGTYPNAVWTGTAHASTSTLTFNAPVVDAGADVSLVEGQTLTRSVGFTDSDTDSWTATVNYGEGAGAVSASVDQAAKTVALSHAYSTPGVYTVTVQVTDSYSQSHSDNFLVTVGPTPDDARRQRPKRIAILQGTGVV